MTPEVSYIGMIRGGPTRHANTR